jgi:hypothetical protein
MRDRSLSKPINVETQKNNIVIFQLVLDLNLSPVELTSQQYVAFGSRICVRGKEMRSIEDR